MPVSSRLPARIGEVARQVRPERGLYHSFPLFLLAGAAIAPLVLAYVTMLSRGWWPEGDDAVTALRIRDVFTAHPPLLGMRATSGVANPDLATHHPGPLAFYVLAVPSMLLGFEPAGLLLGTVLVASASALGVILVAKRRGGWPLAVLMVLAVAVVQWAAGAQSLLRPVNPYPPLLPILLLLLLAWSLLERDYVLLPLFVLVASFVAQGHLAYLPFVTLLSLYLAAVGYVRWFRKRRRPWPLPGWRRHTAVPQRRYGWIAVAVLTLCWLPSMIEIIRFEDDNARLLLRYALSGEDVERQGYVTASRILVAELAPFAGGLSSAVTDPFTYPRDLSALIVGGLVAATVVVGGLLGARRSTLDACSDICSRGLTVAAVALFACWISVASVPQDVVAVPRYWLAHLWPVIAFTWVVLLWTVGRLVSRVASRSDDPRPLMKAWGSHSAAVVCLGAIALAMTTPVELPWRDLNRTTAAAAAVEQALERSEYAGAAVRIDASGFLPWASYSPAIANRLRAHGYRVFATTAWPFPEDTDFRHVDRAPADAVRVVLIQRGDPSAYIPASEESAVPVPVEGDVEIYLVPPRRSA